MSAKIDAQKVQKGDRRDLAKAITLIEDGRPESRAQANALLESLIPQSGKSLRVAITGIPGAGKSTFIESLGMHLIGLGKKVAVLAIDPSGPGSGGSILGDKTRMEKLSVHPQAFVRPSPSGGILGGVARRTREAMILCEAAGHDVVLIETVGVGQSEYEVAHMVDVVILLLAPNTGDELQGIKRGIMEIADVVVVNKADGTHAQDAQVTKGQAQNALALFSHAHAHTEVLLSSAISGMGIPEIWEAVEKSAKTQSLIAKRAQQEKLWFKNLVHEGVQDKISNDKKLSKRWKELEEAVSNKKTGAHAAALEMINSIFGNSNAD